MLKNDPPPSEATVLLSIEAILDAQAPPFNLHDPIDYEPTEGERLAEGFALLTACECDD